MISALSCIAALTSVARVSPAARGPRQGAGEARTLRSRRRVFAPSRLGWALALALGAPGAAAQQSAGEAAETGGTAAQPQAVEAAPATTTTTTSYMPSFVPAPGTNLDAHLPSSAQSKTDINQPDTFDLRRPGASAPIVRGDPDALGILGNELNPAAPEPGKAYHIVRKGDTLWGITEQQLGDPRMWPRVWSYNPHLQNPHWIYPGDQLRMRPQLGAAEPGAVGGIRGGTLGSGIVGRQALVPADTVFLRDLGYIDEPDKEVWGQVVGAREEQQLLADGNQIYMILRPGVDVQLGQLMTIFEDLRDPPEPEGARRPPGKIVAFKGTVKIQVWDAKNRIARGELVESLDVIERGAKVGPIGRRFYVVPPAKSEVDVRARVLTSMYPHVLMGAQQVVFIDRGANDGLEPGNRLFVVRRGDAWRRTLVSTTVMARSRIRMEVPDEIVVEETPLHGDEEVFPEEVIGELRIIRSHRYASLAVITESHEEIEPGDQAVARKGF